MEKRKTEKIQYQEPISNTIEHPEPIDNLTDYGRGISYKTCDGKEVATMEEVLEYNQMYYESMLKRRDEIKYKPKSL